VEPWELKSLLEEHPKIRRITVETRVSSISRNCEETVARVRVGRVDWGSTPTSSGRRPRASSLPSRARLKRR